MVSIAKPPIKPNVQGDSVFSAGIGFNSFTPSRIPFGILSNFDSIRENLRNIIFFRKGDYPDLPDFGVGLQDYLFEPGDELLRLSLNQEMRRQIAKYEPRVIIRILNITTPAWADDSLVVDLDLLVNNVPLSGTAASNGTFSLSQKSVA